MSDTFIDIMFFQNMMVQWCNQASKWTNATQCDHEYNPSINKQIHVEGLRYAGHWGRVKANNKTDISLVSENLQTLQRDNTQRVIT